MEKVTQGQLIALMSHTLGSIGQVMKDPNAGNQDIVSEIQRIYNGYIKQIAGKWNQE